MAGNVPTSGQPIRGEIGICQHSLPQPEEKEGGSSLRIGPAAAPCPAPGLNRGRPLAAPAACRQCVKCRLREVPYNRGLGSPPRVNSARCGAVRGADGSGAAGRRGRGAARLGSARLGTARLGTAHAAMELNSLLILLEAAEYLERRDREAEHGYASVLPFDSDYSRKKTKAGTMARKSQNNRSSHNELEKHRRAKLRLYLEQLKQLVPLGPDSTRHTTLSLLKRAKMHIKKLEEQDRKALNIKEQLQREHRYLKRRLEQLSVQGMERIRTDSMGSTISTDSEQEVDIEGMEYTPGEMDSIGSASDAEDHYSLQSGSSDGGYTHSRRLNARLS
uniref:MAX dimerization protein 4 n=1 Tax=Apteryx owenii TaxID=8824 RepID=A0A8B9PEH4_APTOW